MQIAALKNIKAKQWVDGIKNTFEYLEQTISDTDQIIWIHAPSLGEFEQARPLIKILKKEYVQYKVLVTFYSPSGYEVRKHSNLFDYVCYLPLDTKSNAERFVKLVNPVFTFFVKYDFWPNYLMALQYSNHQHYVISAIFRTNHYVFRKAGAWMLALLSKIDHFFVQNEDSKYLLLTRNITQVTNVGDTRFDRVIEITQNLTKLPILESFKDETPLFIFGSTWSHGEDMLIEFIKHYGNRFKYVIAPHEIRSENLINLESQIQLEVLRYSSANEHNAAIAEVLIIDNIGLLSSLYAYADLAYIGGGFGRGIHNTLEAATFGMPIFIGPNNEKFQEAIDLKKIGVAIEIKSAQEMIAQCDLLLTRPNKWKKLKEKSALYVKEKAGATKKIVQQLF